MAFCDIRMLFGCYWHFLCWENVTVVKDICVLLSSNQPRQNRIPWFPFTFLPRPSPRPSCCFFYWVLVSHEMHALFVFQPGRQQPSPMLTFHDTLLRRYWSCSSGWHGSLGKCHMLVAPVFPSKGFFGAQTFIFYPNSSLCVGGCSKTDAHTNSFSPPPTFCSLSPQTLFWEPIFCTWWPLYQQRSPNTSSFNVSLPHTHTWHRVTSTSVMKFRGP